MGDLSPKIKFHWNRAERISWNEIIRNVLENASYKTPNVQYSYDGANQETFSANKTEFTYLYSVFWDQNVTNKVENILENFTELFRIIAGSNQDGY